MEKDLKPNGFRPKSYGDIVALGTVLATFLALVQWGLKIENKYETLLQSHNNLELEVARGILPRAEERLRNAERHHLELEAEFDAFLEYHRDNFVPARALEPRRQND